MTITIDKDIALEQLRSVVEEFGPHRTEGVCQYSHGNRPCCIVGQVLHRVGVSVDTLHALDNPGTIEGSDIRTLANNGTLAKHGIHLDPAAIVILKVAQRKQDAGNSWGYALAEAEAEAEALEPAP